MAAPTGTGPAPGQVAGPLLPAGDMDAAVAAFLRASPPQRRWNVETDIDYAAADGDRLTDGQRSAVQFVSMIEDHLPGYFALYRRHFPVDDTTDRQTYVHNRELYHFTVRWADEEDSHALALSRYQVAAGLSGADELRDTLAEEGRKEFTLPYRQAVQFFTYPLVQEKATQIYYQHLRAVVGDPVLAGLLGRLSRDEARHYAFFADVLTRYLRRHGDAVVEPIREVVADFRMPLADTMRGYWRWALRIADTASYDHTEAYDSLVRVVERAVDARTDKVDELLRFVRACTATTVPG
jgi:acyl-[acyl-carrier-protein] desaturase